MLKFLSSMLCISNIHPFSPGNCLGASYIIGNLMRVRVINVARMDMITVRMAPCLVCCLVLMVI